MLDRPKEDERSLPPKVDSPAPEIFSKKIFFFNSSYSDSRHSEIPHIESDYCPRDEVSRCLFPQEGGSCECDCTCGGCTACLRRNKPCFFKFFVLALSIVFVLLLFGSLYYNLGRNKAENESSEYEKTEWVSHYHEYSVEKKAVPTAEETTSQEPVLDFPVPVYEHPEDYDSNEDLRKLRYHSRDNPNEGRDQIEPFAFQPYNTQKSNFQDKILFIHDGRDPYKMKRSVSSKEDEELKKLEEDYESPLFEKLNQVEEEMEKFWGIYFKKGKTVFEPFSLTTPLHSTPVQRDEHSPEGNRFSDYSGTTVSVKEESEESDRKVTFFQEQSTSERSRISEEEENWRETETLGFSTVSSGQMTTTDTSEYLTLEKDVTDEMENDIENETTEKERWDVREKSEEILPEERLQKEFPRWSFHFTAPLSGIFGSNNGDETSAEQAPLSKVKGISLADAKKIKKERRKQMLLNSRVVGGSSDVRIPTGPDISKPFVNAFETLKTNQQLSFTPSATSQFILPYQMCLFAGSVPGVRPPPVQAVQPRTLSFGAPPPLIPSIFDKSQSAKNPYHVPSQQNILSFSINNYPGVFPPRQPNQPSGGSAFNLPTQQQFFQSPGPNKQPIFCTYLQPPLFQFPTVPGTADFSHAKCVDCREESRTHSPFAQGTLFSPGKDGLCSDEKVSCVDGSSCVPPENWCDNRVHCKDASDEAYCSCRERVARERLCDGYVDCPNGEDETGCFGCPKSAFSCESIVSPGSCIPLSKRCDGVTDCLTGADEADCSALFFHVRHNDSYHVPQVAGYLHRNWNGNWFPVCVEIGENLWAQEACFGELGVSSTGVEVKFAPVSTLYKGPFIVRKEDGTPGLQDHCKGHVSTFVKCPEMSCGTRIEQFTLQETENEYFKRELRPVFMGKKENGTIREKEERLKREETGRVVGGRESEPKAWPWAIAVYTNGAFHCGGVILDEKWVLTAAHCMEQFWKHYYEVRGGMLRRFSFSAMEQVRAVSHVIVHENYDMTIMSNDLALLRLQEPFHFNRWVRPACLPALQDGISKFVSGPAPGTRCTAVGWGALKERGTGPDQLREVEIPIMVKCKHKDDLVGEEICAGKLEGGKDTCQGDSGGPLLCRDSDHPAVWYVAGIVSHGEGCARPGEPGAYTRISLFVDWITANTDDFRLPTIRPLQSCPGFRCRSASKLCIPRKWVCNGFTDCLEAEDERNCTSDPGVPTFFSNRFSSQYKYFEEKDVERLDFGGKFSTEQTLTSEFVSTTGQVETESIKAEEKWVPLSKGIGGMEKIFSTEEVKERGTFEKLTEPISTTTITTTTTPITTSTTTTTTTPVTTSTTTKTAPLISTTTTTTAPFTSSTTTPMTTTTTTPITPSTTAETQMQDSLFKTLEESSPILDKIGIGTLQRPETSTESVETKEEIKDGKKHLETSWEEKSESESVTDKGGKPTEAKSESDAGERERSEEKNEKEIDDYGETKSAVETTATERQDRIEDEEEGRNEYERKNKEEEDRGGKKEKDIDEDLEDEEYIGKTTERQNRNEDERNGKKISNENERKNKEEEDRRGKKEKDTDEDLEDEKYVGKTTEKQNRNEDERNGKNMSNEDERKNKEEDDERKKKEKDTDEDLEDVEYLGKTTEKQSNEDERNEDEGNEKNMSNEDERENKEEDDERKKKKEDTDEDLEDEKYSGTKEKSSEEDEESNEKTSVQTSGEFQENLSVTESIASQTTEIVTSSNDEKEETELYTESTMKNSEVEESETSTDFGETPAIRFDVAATVTQLWTRTPEEPETQEDESTGSIETSTAFFTSTPLQRFTRTIDPIDTSLSSDEYSTPSFDPDSSRRNLEEVTLVDSKFFQCRLIVQSILSNYRCDGLEDCEDGTDEEDCFCAETLFLSNPEMICNGRVDCPDGSDEKNCSSCLADEFFCKNTKKCIPSRSRCDDTIDCEFGEDEANCLALTKNGEMELQNNGEPLLETEGVLMINRNGVWDLKCQEEVPTFGGAEAIQVCSALRTIGYEMYENRSMALNCTGFHVTCAEVLVSSMERYKNQDGTYLWPWNAFVYSDGAPICSGVLLRPRWLLTSSNCLRGISFKKNYVVAKLGATNWTSEEGVEMVRIDGSRVIPDSDIALLHLSKEVNQTESIRLLGIPYTFDSDPEKDLCVAVGDRTVFLKPSEPCAGASRCFTKLSSTATDCKSKPYVGVVVCQSRFGWYPASVFSEEYGHCGFKRARYTSLKEKLKPLYHALDKKSDFFPEPKCNGFRCSQGLCIRRSQLCDGYKDCSSAEDENVEYCRLNKEIKECKITEMKCRNGRCIPKILFGDGKNDCGDDSDEPINKTCAEYLRLTSPNRICDGRRNCHDKTDEDYRLCPCDRHRFRCKLSDYCIPKDFVCDGEEDCPGGEDEEHCMGRRMVKNHTKVHLEVMQRSYGIWHTACSDRMSKERSDALCKDLGFKEASSTFDRNQTIIAPEVDAFSWVKLNQKTRVALRGSKPFVKLISSNRTCSYVKCA